MKILIIENNHISRYQLETVLTKWGYEFISCSGIERGRKILQQDNPPDMVILDWSRPDFDWIYACQEIRQSGNLYFYILLLTMESDRENRILGMDMGADGYLARPFNLVELKSQLEAGKRNISRQAELIGEVAELKHKASRDFLTGLWNRREILSILQDEINRATREDAAITTMIMDLDHFKKINDTHGHSAGDAVLREVAKRVSSSIRKYDSIGRYGGEEFLLVFPGCCENSIKTVAEKVRTIIYENEMKLPDIQMSIPVTASLGGAVISETRNADPITLINKADQALYMAKRNGRNQVVISSMEEMTNFKMEVG